ncbi:MAG TPA: antitoxin Xre/MbcA/ParS toxin-binding domain-containing protein [Usitatibacter sp.]|nr:antitoxin Xre/MbcA/ParS toxin-binding domain-containing protein [Usitatibacter sp.]
MDHPARKPSAPRKRKVSAARSRSRPPGRGTAKERLAEVSHYVARLQRATSLDLVQMEREGVPGALIKNIGLRINVPMQRLYDMLGAPKATMERKAASNKPVTGAVGQSALGLVKLLARAESMVAESTSPGAKGFDTARWLGEWLETPQPALGGRRPAEMLDTPTGVAIVEKTLGALASGSYL